MLTPSRTSRAACSTDCTARAWLARSTSMNSAARRARPHSGIANSSALPSMRIVGDGSVACQGTHNGRSASRRARERPMTTAEASRVAIVREAAASDYRFSSIVMGIVKSTPFQMSKVE